MSYYIKKFSGSAIILAYMHGHKGRIDIRGEMTFSNLPPEQVRNTLSRLTKRGFVIKISHGVYGLNEVLT